MTLLSPILNAQQLDINGDPLSGGKIETFLAGTSTPAATYTDLGGLTAQANPIILNTLGLPTDPIWLTENVAYKMVVSDSADVIQRTVDDVTGVTVEQPVVQSEWLVYTPVATYISATSFSVSGDQRTIFHIGRRVRSTNTGGVGYHTITNSVFGSGITTLTLKNDSLILDSGLSAMSYGILSSVDPSYTKSAQDFEVLKSFIHAATVIVASATTTLVGAAASNNVDISGTVQIDGFDTVPAGIRKKGRFTGAGLQLTHHATSFILPNDGDNIDTEVGDIYEAMSLGSGNWIFLSYVRASGAPTDGGLPVGAVIDFAADTPPVNFINCDGASLLRAGTYAELFAVIGTVYGSVDGTHFNLPQCQRQVIMGKGGTSVKGPTNAVGDQGGVEEHQLTEAELAAHLHTTKIVAVAASSHTGILSTIGTTDALLGTVDTDSVGGDTAHINVQPSLVMTKCIKYK